MQLNPQAEELNEIISKNSKPVLALLSSKGKAIFFPKKGILAQAAEARGKKINASIGMALEDDGSPLCLDTISKLVDLDKKDCFNYAPSYGKKELRVKWKELIFEKNPSLKGETSLPVVTNALTHALSISAYLFLDEGNELIVPTPFWGNYKLIFVNGFGIKLNQFPLFKDNAFNIAGLKEKLNAPGEKKVVLLNFPNNPTGYTPTVEEAKNIAAVIKEAAENGKHIAVLVDDAYFGLIYEEGIFKESLFSKLADLHENILAIKIDGATKEDYVWGFRVGFITFATKGGSAELYNALADKVSGAVRGNISNAPHISQSLILKSFSDPNYKSQKKEKFETLKKRYDKVKEILENHPEYKKYFEALSFNSGYFMCIELKDLEAEEIRQRLLKNYDTGLIAMGKLIRVAFSSTPFPLLEELFENVYKACSNEKQG